jgi:hypothetical protein
MEDKFIIRESPINISKSFEENRHWWLIGIEAKLSICKLRRHKKSDGIARNISKLPLRRI